MRMKPGSWQLTLAMLGNFLVWTAGALAQTGIGPADRAPGFPVVPSFTQPAMWRSRSLQDRARGFPGAPSFPKVGANPAWEFDQPRFPQQFIPSIPIGAGSPNLRNPGLLGAPKVGDNSAWGL